MGKVGGTLGEISGYPSIPISHFDSMSSALTQRIGNAVRYQLSNGASKEIANAMRYYYSQTATLMWKTIVPTRFCKKRDTKGDLWKSLKVLHMECLVIILGVLILSICTVLTMFLLREIVFHFSFLTASKTRVRKTRKAQSTTQKISLLYTLQYENRLKTAFCLGCYYVFCVCSITLLMATIANLFIGTLFFYQWLWSWFGRLISASVFLSFLCVLTGPKKEKH